MKFIDFILEAQKDPRLLADFMLIEDENALETFFKSRGYTNIDSAECKKILEAKKIQYRMPASHRY